MISTDITTQWKEVRRTEVYHGNSLFNSRPWKNEQCIRLKPIKKGLKRMKSGKSGAVFPQASEGLQNSLSASIIPHLKHRLQKRIMDAKVARRYSKGWREGISREVFPQALKGHQIISFIGKRDGYLRTSLSQRNCVVYSFLNTLHHISHYSQSSQVFHPYALGHFWMYTK